MEQIIKKTVVLEKWLKKEKKLISLIKKMEKHGVKSNFTWKISGTPYEKELEQTIIYDNNNTLRKSVAFIKKFTKVIDIEFSGDIPVIKGWTIAGHLLRIPSSEKFTIDNFLENELLPERIKTHDPKICEHCGVKRLRNELYVLKRGDEIKVVGSSCVNDFVGQKSVIYLTNYLSYLSTIDTTDKFDFKYDKRVHTKSFLYFCAQSIIEHGYRKEGGTKSHVLGNAHEINVTKEAEKLAEEAIERIKNLPKSDIINEFNYSMQLIVNSEYISMSQTGIASYIVENHLRKTKKEIAIKNELADKSNEFVGDIGERREFTLKYIRTGGFDSQYGWVYYHNFEDEEGNVVVWRASTSLVRAYEKLKIRDNDVEFDDDLTGCKFKVKATIKQHTIFKERKQTTVIRLTMLEEIK